MENDEQEKLRRQERLLAFVTEKFEGDKAAAGRALGYRDGAYIGQMLRGERPITEKFIRKVELRHGCTGWFALGGGHGVAEAQNPYRLDANQSNRFVTTSSLTPLASGAVIRVPWISRARLVEALWQTGDGVISEGEPLLIAAERHIDPRTKAVRVWDDSLSPILRAGDAVLLVPVAPTARPPFGAVVLAQINDELPELRLCETLKDGSLRFKHNIPGSLVWDTSVHRVTLLARKAGQIHFDPAW